MSNIFKMTKEEKISVKKSTLKRLSRFGNKGERHNNLVSRLLDSCEDSDFIDLDEHTVKRLMRFGDSDDVDEVLIRLMDVFEKKKKKL